MTEYSAQVAHLLVEQRRGGVRIAISGEQKWMTALNANVLVIIVPIDQVLIRVVSQKTGQGVTHMRQRAIEAEVCGTAPARAMGRVRGCEKDMIVDVVAPQPASYSSHGSRLRKAYFAYLSEYTSTV
jgi:hypothetical protein